MASRPDPLPYERRLRELEAIYDSAQVTLADRIETAIRSGDLRTAQRVRLQLSAAVAVLDQLGATVTPLSRAIVRDAYQQGSDRALAQIRRLNVHAPEIPGAFAGVQREAVEALQASLLDRLDSSRQTLGRQVEDIYAREQRRAAVRSLLGANGSSRTAAQDLSRRLLENKAIAKSVEESGVGFVDRAGKRWQLDTYSKMATRTVTREAAVQGAIARMATHGISLARVSAHASACKICLPWEGRLISLDGSVSEYQGEAVYDDSRLPPFHPNCAHSIAPVATRIQALKDEMQLAGRL